MRLRSLIPCVLACGPALLCAADKNEPSWPQFRGVQGTGIAGQGANPPVEFGPARKVLWRTELPSGHSSPSIWGGRIFVTAFDKSSNKLEAIALDRKTGAILWRKSVRAQTIETVHAISSPATATPVVDGERVYVYFGSYGLAAYDLDGKEQWTAPLPIPAAPYGSGSSPILAGGLLILSRDENKDPCLMAFDPRTGKTAWKTAQYDGAPPRGFHASTPAVWKGEIVVHHREEIAGFDLKTGTKKWWVGIATQGTNTPVAGPDAIYVGAWVNTGEPDLIALPDFDTLLKKYDANGDGVIVLAELPAEVPFTRRVGMENIPRAGTAVPKNYIFGPADRDRDGRLTREEWDKFVANANTQFQPHGLIAVTPGGEGNVTKTGVLWKEARGVPEVPTPLYYQGRVYAVTNGGIVTALDAKTGKLIFRERLAAGGAYLASPIEAGGRLYFASADGILSVVEAGEHMKTLAQNDFGEPLYATPAVIGNTIYVRTPTKLYAFGDGK